MTGLNESIVEIGAQFFQSPHPDCRFSLFRQKSRTSACLMVIRPQTVIDFPNRSVLK